MSLRFKWFRKSLIVFIILLYLLIIGFAFFLRPYLARQDSVWILVSIPLSMIAGCVMSIFHVKFFGTPQTVVWELVWLSGFLPFALIVAFVIYTGTTGDVAPAVTSVLYAAEIVVFIACSIHLLYALSLLLSATLTSFAFDRDIWTRDLDASPSPFPAGFLLRYYTPCLRRSATNPTTEIEYAIRGYPMPTPHTEETEVKIAPSAPDSPTISSASPSGLASQESQASSQASERKLSGHRPTGSRASLASTLIQVPDEFQKRTSIQVSFQNVV
ncbi:hypothetical protein GGF50DRAFT_130325 [Schizophyllum commune]